MSEEEQEAIEFFKNLEFDEYEWWINDGKSNSKEEDFDRFEKTWSTLLNYISKLEKEVEQAKKQLDLDYVDNNFIHKDKIRDKIEELRKREKELEKLDYEAEPEKAIDCVLLRIADLEDLLKEN